MDRDGHMDSQTHGQPNTWTAKHMDKDGQPNTWTEMDRQIMHLQFPVVEFPPRRVVLPKVATTTDAC